MSKQILIDALHPEEVRVVLVDNSSIVEFDYENLRKKQLKGNIYLGKITRIEPSLQAAFVEYADDKFGFLPFAEIHPDYYQIPASDKKELLSALDKKNEAESIKEEIEEKEVGDDGENEQLAPDNENHGKYRRPISGRVKDSEDIAGDDVDISSLSHRQLSDRYKIQEVLKKNQLILVQVIKEERGNKGVSLTTYVSLAGRYCVLMPNSPKKNGVSRKIESFEERKKLKKIVADLKKEEGASIIIRTFGKSKNKTDIEKDYGYLASLWNDIRKKTLSSTAPSLIHIEADTIKRTLRDLFDDSVSSVLIEGDEVLSMARDFIKLIAPENLNRVKEYKNKIPIFSRYKIEEQIKEFFNSKVMLSSGGYIVINPTEALVSIDVNSGRSTKERNVEETALSTNIEAANEIARQIRIRDLSGLIVIDFIDMENTRNRKEVERILKNATKDDRARIQLGRISQFGLLEMSRQRLRSSLIESSMVTCDHCVGTGYIKSPEAGATRILRLLETNLHKISSKVLDIHVNPLVMNYILNYKRPVIKKIEDIHGINIFFHSKNDIEIDNAILEEREDLSSEEMIRMKMASEYKVIKKTTSEKSLIHDVSFDEYNAKYRGRRKSSGLRGLLSRFFS